MVTSESVSPWWCMDNCGLACNQWTRVNGGPAPLITQLSPNPSPQIRLEPTLSLWKDHVAIGRIVISALMNHKQKVDWQTPIAWTGGGRHRGQGEFNSLIVYEGFWEEFWIIFSRRALPKRFCYSLALKSLYACCPVLILHFFFFARGSLTWVCIQTPIIPPINHTEAVCIIWHCNLSNRALCSFRLIQSCGKWSIQFTIWMIYGLCIVTSFKHAYTCGE